MIEKAGTEEEKIETDPEIIDIGEMKETDTNEGHLTTTEGETTTKRFKVIERTTKIDSLLSH